MTPLSATVSRCGPHRVPGADSLRSAPKFFSLQQPARKNTSFPPPSYLPPLPHRWIRRRRKRPEAWIHAARGGRGGSAAALPKPDATRRHLPRRWIRRWPPEARRPPPRRPLPPPASLLPGLTRRGALPLAPVRCSPLLVVTVARCRGPVPADPLPSSRGPAPSFSPVVPPHRDSLDLLLVVPASDNSPPRPPTNLPCRVGTGGKGRPRPLLQRRPWRGRVARSGRGGMSREERGDLALPSHSRERQKASCFCVFCWRVLCYPKTLCAMQNAFGLHCWSQSKCQCTLRADIGLGYSGTYLYLIFYLKQSRLVKSRS
jgi:hypothetical protein